MYFYLLEAAVEHLGETGRVLVGGGLRDAAKEQAKVFIEQADATERCIDKQYLIDHLPLNLDIGSEPLWERYDKHGAKQLLYSNFYKVLFKEVGYTEEYK